MTSVILIPWAQTDWQAVGRYASTTPVAVNEHGEQQISRWAEVIAPHDPAVVYCVRRNPSDQTAHGISGRLKIKMKIASGLEEVNMGLWEGLTPEQKQRRFARSFRQWKEDPAGVRPPEGEDVVAAAERVANEFHRLARKHNDECLAIVLGPLALAALRCKLEDVGFEVFWDMDTDKPVKYLVNVENNKAILTT